MLNKIKNKLFSKSRLSSEIILTPSEFVELYEKAPSKIISSEIIPPVIGNSDFGRIRVILDSTSYNKPQLTRI